VRLAVALGAALGAYLAWTAARIALHDGLTSIADDSSNYLVMARYLSPWLPAGEAVREAWMLQYFPPLFPLLLALSGASQSLLAAHLLVLVLAAFALPALWRLYAREFGLGAGAASALLAIVVLSPGFLLGLQGVLSESLFLLLTALLLALDRSRPGADLRAALLLAAAMLTRSAGAVLLLAVLAQAGVEVACRRRRLRDALAMPAVALLCWLSASWLLSPPATGEYAGIWRALAERAIHPGDFAPARFLGTQATALFESWCTFFVVYWTADRPALPALAGLAAVPCLAGLLMRLRANRLDAWYAAGTLAMLLAWPYPGQMLRFLFPLVPVLLAQGAWCTVWLARRLRLPLLPPAAGIALLALALPPHAWLHGRLALARELGMVPVYEWLRRPGAADARRELGLQNRMLHDLRELAGDVGPRQVVAFYEPSYVVLLANRHAIPLPMPARVESVAGRADFVLLTAIHPRQSRVGVDGLALPPQELARLRLVWCHADPLEGQPSGCLYRIDG
jgi:hypothetical protein